MRSDERGVALDAATRDSFAAAVHEMRFQTDRSRVALRS
jgi:hypothetical protein